MSTREKLLDAAIAVFLDRGYSRASVDEICRAAGTTKGAFFHHFESKEEVGLLALDRFATAITSAFANTVETDEPVSRVFQYLDGVVTVGNGIDPYPACLVALLTLELAAANPRFREAADAAFTRWLTYLEQLFSDALAALPHRIDATPRGLAEYFVATTEGAWVLARARNDKTVVEQSMARVREHLRQLMNPPEEVRA